MLDHYDGPLYFVFTDTLPKLLDLHPAGSDAERLLRQELCSHEWITDCSFRDDDTIVVSCRSQYSGDSRWRNEISKHVNEVITKAARADKLPEPDYVGCRKFV